MSSSNTFEFHCPYCGQRLAANVDDVGADVDCPSCYERFPIPRPPGSSGMRRAISETFEFECPSCSQALEASPPDVGEQVQCPVCDALFPIPRPGEKAELKPLELLPDGLAPTPPKLGGPTKPHVNGGFEVAEEPLPVDPPPDAEPLSPNAPSAGPTEFQFEFSDEDIPTAPLAGPDNDPDVSDFLAGIPDFRTHTSSSMIRRVTSQGSVPVIQSLEVKSGSRFEDLSEKQARQVRLLAVRAAIEEMGRTQDYCAAFDMTPESAQEMPGDTPLPQMVAYLRPKPTSAKGSWVFLFWRHHLLAYRVATREEWLIHPEALGVSVKFDPGKNDQAHLGFRVTQKEEPICLVKLALPAKSPQAAEAREWVAQIRTWVSKHPVLGLWAQRRKQRIGNTKPLPRPNGRAGSSGRQRSPSGRQLRRTRSPGGRDDTRRKRR